MKAGGFVRLIDSLGRIALPVELRERLRIHKKGSVTIHGEGETIVIEPYGKACLFCGDTESLTEYRGHLICEGCMTDIAHSAAVSL